VNRHLKKRWSMIALEAIMLSLRCLEEMDRDAGGVP